MLRAFLILTLGFAALTGSGAGIQAQNERPPLIGVTSIAFSSEIQAIVDGMRDRLAERGFVTGTSIAMQVRDAGANGDMMEKIVLDFAKARARLIVAITTPAIRTALNADTRIPVVGASIPFEAATALSNEHRRRPLTGVAESDTRDDQLSLIRMVAPDVSTVAIPADPAGGPLADQLQPWIAAARRHGITVTPLAVSIARNTIAGTISDLDPQRSTLLLDRALLHEAPVEALAEAAAGRKLRLLATDEDSVIRGALAAIVIDPFGIGQQLGEVVADILEIPSAARLPFRRARASRLVLNEDGRGLIDIAAIEDSLGKNQRSVIDWAEDGDPRPSVKPAPPAPPSPLGVARGITVPAPRSRPPAPTR